MRCAMTLVLVAFFPAAAGYGQENELVRRAIHANMDARSERANELLAVTKHPLFGSRWIVTKARTAQDLPREERNRLDQQIAAGLQPLTIHKSTNARDRAAFARERLVATRAEIVKRIEILRSTAQFERLNYVLVERTRGGKVGEVAGFLGPEFTVSELRSDGTTLVTTTLAPMASNGYRQGRSPGRPSPPWAVTFPRGTEVTVGQSPPAGYLLVLSGKYQFELQSAARLQIPLWTAVPVATASALVDAEAASRR